MKKLGFTLIELIIVFGIIAALSGIIIIVLSPRTRTVALTSTVNQVLADFQAQQAKAMANAYSYGIFFEKDQYTLFKGVNYNAEDLANAVYPAPAHVTFHDIRLPSASVVFIHGSGEVAGYSPAENFVTIKQETSGELKTFTVNPYGIITQVQ